MFRPKSVNIFSIPFSITYVACELDVDAEKRRELWGQIDYHTQSIRIYDNGGKLSESDILSTILEEVMHGVSCKLKLDCFESEVGHKELTALCQGLADVFLRNGWIKTRGVK